MLQSAVKRRRVVSKGTRKVKCLAAYLNEGANLPFTVRSSALARTLGMEDRDMSDETYSTPTKNQASWHIELLDAAFKGAISKSTTYLQAVR